MTAAKMRQQFMLRVLADHVVRALHPDTGLVQLLKQPVHRHFEYLGELRDGYICHTAAP